MKKILEQLERGEIKTFSQMVDWLDKNGCNPYNGDATTYDDIIECAKTYGHEYDYDDKLFYPLT